MGSAAGESGAGPEQLHIVGREDRLALLQVSIFTALTNSVDGGQRCDVAIPGQKVGVVDRSLKPLREPFLIRFQAALSGPVPPPG